VNETEVPATTISTVYRLLCTESGFAALHVDGRWGVSCQASELARAADALLVTALIKKGGIAAALPQATRLWADRASANAQLNSTLKKIATQPNVNLGLAMPGAKITGMHFIDEERVYFTHLRAAFNLTARALEAKPEVTASAESPLAVQRTCWGYVGRSAELGDAIKKPWYIESMRPPPESSCSTQPGWRTSHNGGWTYMGRANQNALFVRAYEGVLSRPDGSTEKIADDQPFPAGNMLPALTADGRTYALTNPLGIVLITRGPQPQARLFAIDNASEITRVAVSLRGTRIAFIQHGQLKWIALG